MPLYIVIGLRSGQFFSLDRFFSPLDVLTTLLSMSMLIAMANRDTSDSKERFTSRVDAYVKARPRYPRQVINHLATAIGLTPQWTIADIGSGTGISCELFLANGNTVFGVEPNAAMRKAAEQSLAEFAGSFHSIDASAEATGLPDHSIDLVVAAQAFHWFDIEKTRREFMRILKPRGWTLLMWNNRKLGGTPFLEAYEKLLIDFGTDYLKVRHNNINDSALHAFFGHAGYQTAVLPNDQRHDFDGLRARLLSSSYVPGPDDPRHGPMLSALQTIFDRYNEAGQITIEYQTELLYGQFTPAA